MAKLGEIAIYVCKNGVIGISYVSAIRVIVEILMGVTMHKVGGVLVAGVRTKRFWYGAMLAGAVLGLASNTQAEQPTAKAEAQQTTAKAQAQQPISKAQAQRLVAKAAEARAWAPGVADKRGRVINPIFRKEKDRAAPTDRGMDPDAVAPSKPKAPAGQTPPPVVVTPNSSKGSSGR